MNAIHKLLIPLEDKPFKGDLGLYLSEFFDGNIPVEAMEIESWDELRSYLSRFVITKLPETEAVVSHPVYGFEKDRLFKILIKKIFY